MSDPDDRTAGPQPGESQKERIDRELIELLNGLRVILPGVQVILAFLLTVIVCPLWHNVTFFFFLAALGSAPRLSSPPQAEPASSRNAPRREGDADRELVRESNRANVMAEPPKSPENGGGGQAPGRRRVAIVDCEAVVT